MKPGVDYTGITTSFHCNDGKGKFLFHKRSINCRDEHGTWDCGAGRLGFGETPEKSVLREVQEEYGCQGKIQKRLSMYSLHREWEGQPTHWLTIPFFILVDPKEVKINEPEHIDAVDWFTLNDLPQPLHTGFQQTYKKYQKYFEAVARYKK